VTQRRRRDQKLAQGVSPGNMEECDERRRRDRSTEDVSTVIIDAMLLQQSDEFIFKRHFAMVLFLILNVPLHGVHV
jgi:hypothetical protein